MLFTSDTDRPAIIIDHKGIEKVEQNETTVLLHVSAGENWHQFVLWAIEHDLGGIENLSLIPGKCGAAPMQNIGAYGVEISQVLEYVDVIERDSFTEKRIPASDCGLGYRTSIFKSEAKDKYVIVAVGIRLTKPGFHKINTSYGAINEELQSAGVEKPTIRDISDAVISIRQKKLPNPTHLPNAGSFFKNPIVPLSLYEKLLLEFPSMPSYPVSETTCKVPAGWLIDQRGWKGVSVGDVAVHNRQALVLVNHGAKSCASIWKLAQMVQQSVLDTYGIDLVPEVNVLP